MQMYVNESSIGLELIRLPIQHWRANESERPYWALSQRMGILTNLRHLTLTNLEYLTSVLSSHILYHFALTDKSTS